MKENNVKLSVDSVVSFPDDTIIEDYDSKNKIVIAINEAKWMVLSNKEEVDILKMLQVGMPISDLLNKFDEKSISVLLSKVYASRINCNEKSKQYINMKNECMYVYLTQGCNLRCKHCYMFSGTKLKNELTVEQWKKVLCNFKSCGGKAVNFTGGEPLLHAGFSELVKYADSIGLVVGVLSNGLLWTDGLINELKEHINDVQISIDGTDNTSYNKIRIGGSFEKVVDNAIKIARSGIHLTVATTFTFDNLDDNIKNEYKNLVEKIKEAANKNIDFRLSKKILDGRDVHYSDKKNKLYYDKIKEIESSINPNGAEFNFIEGHIEPVSNCGIGGITVASDGHVYYCNRISEFTSDGNILDKPMEYFIKRGDELNKATSVDNVYPCKKCTLRYICGGGCRIDNFSIHGSEVPKIISKKNTEDCKHDLLKKMVESFNKYYKF